MATKMTIRWEDFLAAGEEGQRWEWVDGEINFMTPVNFRHELILRRLMESLADYCRSHPDWIWIPSNAVFEMASGSWRCPDASLVRKSRFPGGVLPTQRAEIAPDVAFEIHSPGDRPGVVQRKRKDYQESGVIQVWIDSEKCLAELIYPDRPLPYFQEGQPLVIDKLPGIALDLRTLFSV
jgi:Uma2 family endonuclease